MISIRGRLLAARSLLLIFTVHIPFSNTACTDNDRCWNCITCVFFELISWVPNPCPHGCWGPNISWSMIQSQVTTLRDILFWSKSHFHHGHKSKSSHEKLCGPKWLEWLCRPPHNWKAVRALLLLFWGERAVRRTLADHHKKIRWYQVSEYSVLKLNHYFSWFPLFRLRSHPDTMSDPTELADLIIRVFACYTDVGRVVDPAINSNNKISRIQFTRQKLRTSGILKMAISYIAVME